MKTWVSILAVVFVSAVGYAQVAGQMSGAYAARVERAHFGPATPIQKSKTEQLIKSAKVSQAAASAELRELAQAYPAQAAEVQTIVNMHDRLASLLRNEQRVPEGYFYQNVLFLMEDLAAAVSEIKNETLAQACQAAIDHGYYFMPIGYKLSSLQVIADRVKDKVDVLSNGYATPQWGNFYQHLDGYSN